VKEEDLEGPIAEAAKQLKPSLAKLSRAARSRLDKPDDEHRKQGRSELGAAFRATHDWLHGWAELGEERGGELAATARTIYEALFGDGLKFMLLPYNALWGEAEQRLAWLAEHDADEAFAALGGSRFVEELRAAHKKYGKVIGIKEAHEIAEPASVREPLDEFCSRLRRFVLLVAADAEVDDEAAARAERLLRPLAEQRSLRGKVTAEASEPEAPALPPAPSAPISPSDADRS
jgi:hypothetical protein